MSVYISRTSVLLGSYWRLWDPKLGCDTQHTLKCTMMYMYINLIKVWLRWSIPIRRRITTIIVNPLVLPETSPWPPCRSTLIEDDNSNSRLRIILINAVCYTHWYYPVWNQSVTQNDTLACRHAGDPKLTIHL